jgi:hypothetical protein
MQHLCSAASTGNNTLLGKLPEQQAANERAEAKSSSEPLAGARVNTRNQLFV